MAATPSPTAPSARLLIRGVNWLGDAVMTTPALGRLRERFPGAHIALLTHEKLAPLWANHPSLNEILTLSQDESPWSVARRLRAQCFDTALLFPNSHRSALEVFLARIPRRAGYARPLRNWLLTQPVDQRPGHVAMRKRSVREIEELVGVTTTPRESSGHGSGPNPEAGDAHHVRQYLHLAAALGATAKPSAPELCVTESEVRAVEAKFDLGQVQTSGRPILGLNPGAEYGPAKRWPEERFSAVAVDVQKRTDCVWLVFGGPHDAALANAIAARSGLDGRQLRVLAGQTSLRELMALLKLCRVLLTNDSGPMHVAAALGTPVVVPFGSTSPELTGPGLVGDSRQQWLRADVPCAPCFLRTCPIDFRCMKGITVEQVVGAVDKVLSDSSSARI
jgi:heptosyltransferase II